MKATMNMRGVGTPDFDPQRSRWIPWAIVAFFAVITAVQVVLVWCAIGTFSGLTNDNPYEHGIAYNRTLALKAAESDLGWKVTLVWHPDGTAPAQGQLELRLRDRLDQPLQGAEIKARLRRPLGPESAVETALTPGEPGQYLADLALPLRGQWDVDLDLVTATGNDHLTDRIFAK